MGQFSCHMDTMQELNDPPRRDGPAIATAPLAVVGEGLRSLIRQVLAILGMFFIIIGVPLAMLTPFPFIPIGLPVVILGVVLLGRNSLWGRRWMEGILDRHPTVERFAPDWLMKLVFGRDKQHLHEEQGRATPTSPQAPEKSAGPDASSSPDA